MQNLPNGLVAPPYSPYGEMAGTGDMAGALSTGQIFDPLGNVNAFFQRPVNGIAPPGPAPARSPMLPASRAVVGRARPTPPIMAPQALPTQGIAPQAPAFQPTPTANYNPAARDQALRALATRPTM